MNKKYSMAAFARDLGLSASQLSKVLSGKQDLSREKAQLLGHKLFPQEIRKYEQFLQLFLGAVSSKEPDMAAAKIASEKLQGKHDVELDTNKMRFVAQWYVAPAFDLLGMKQPPTSASEIADRLGIDLSEAESALRALESIGLIRADGVFFSKVTESFRTSNNIPSRELRNIHRQFIGKALQSIDTQSLEQRYLRSRTLSVSSSLIPRLREAIDRLIHEIDTVEALSVGQADLLYQLNVQLFDLIKSKGHKPDEDIA